jgi:hypothetical protein
VHPDLFPNRRDAPRGRYHAERLGSFGALLAVLLVVIVGSAPAALARPAPARSAATTGGWQSNLAPHPDFRPYCGWHLPNAPRCIALELAAINHARRHERLRKPMVLPQNYRSLTYGEQIFVITNLERVDRGLLPIVELTPELDAIARRAAGDHEDPVPTAAVDSLLSLDSWTAIWADDLGPLAADYDWMYHDGYSPHGIRILGCSPTGRSGCWAHRMAILDRYPGRTLVAGASASKPYGESAAEIVASRPSPLPLPPATYTWKTALAHGADRRSSERVSKQ